MPKSIEEYVEEVVARAPKTPRTCLAEGCHNLKADGDYCEEHPPAEVPS